MDGIPPELALEVTSAVTDARESGYGLYKALRQIAKDKLSRMEIPSALHGLYLAFVNELINKVLRRRVAEPPEIVDKWEKYGLNRDYLIELGARIVEAYPAVTPESAKKVT